MTIFFNSHDIQLYRRKRKGSTNRFAMSATLTVFDADLQPSGAERVEMFGGKYGQVYDTYMDVSIDVKEGDQMLDTATGKRYSVKGITKWEGFGALDYNEIVIMSMDGSDE